MENTKGFKIKDYIQEVDEKAERRFHTAALAFAEVETNGAKTQDDSVIEGYAAVFNKDSEDFGGWIERISPGAFKDVLKDDAFALFNHSMNHVLGRNGVNVKLTEDNIGLRYSVKLPDTSLANDVRNLVKAGIIDKSSFAFTVQEERFVKGDGKTPHMRIIDKVERLYDVSPVTIPAYTDTSVAARGFEKSKGIVQISNALDMQKYKYRRKFLEHTYNQLFNF